MKLEKEIQKKIIGIFKNIGLKSREYVKPLILGNDVRIDFWKNKDNFIKEYPIIFIENNDTEYLSRCFLEEHDKIEYFILTDRTKKQLKKPKKLF